MPQNVPVAVPVISGHESDCGSEQLTPLSSFKGSGLKSQMLENIRLSRSFVLLKGNETGKQTWRTYVCFSFDPDFVYRVSSSAIPWRSVHACRIFVIARVGTEGRASQRWSAKAIESNRHTTCMEIRGSVVSLSFFFFPASAGINKRRKKRRNKWGRRWREGSCQW